MRVIQGIAGLKEVIGEELGVSQWQTIDQNRIQGFADVTGDHQWIHVDPVRAAQGPYRTTIAHGFLALSMMPALANQIYDVTGVEMVVNYGLEKVRFPAPVPVNSRVRNRVQILSVTPSPRGFQVLVKHLMEREGFDRPVCLAEQIRLMVEGQ